MVDNSWKKDAWDFFAAGVGFWILKTGTTRAEKIVVGVLALVMVVFTVFL